MSLAVPASYSEYYYTSQNDNLICDGGIMPLRNGASNSTSYKYCLRAEDLMFLNEANNIRGRCCKYSFGVPTPTKTIESNKLNNIRNNIGALWNYGSPTAPTLQAHNFGNDNSGIDQYIQNSFGSKTRYSGSDTYTALRSDQIMNLFKDIKQLNYFYTVGGNRSSAVPYQYQRGCETETTYSDGSSPSHNTYSGYVWYDSIDERYYEGALDYSDVTTTISNYATFNVYSSGDMIPKTLVDLAIWGEFLLHNYAGKMNEYSEWGDSTDVYTYVLVPIKSAYTDMTNVTVPTITSNELNAAINLAFSTANLQKSSSNIPCTAPSGQYSSIYHTATSYAELERIYYFTHVRYCNLENVNV